MIRSALLAVAMTGPKAALRVGPGIGPARAAGYAVVGGPETLAEAAPLLDGVVLDIDWTHDDVF